MATAAGSFSRTMERGHSCFGGHGLRPNDRAGLQLLGKLPKKRWTGLSGCSGRWFWGSEPARPRGWSAGPLERLTDDRPAVRAKNQLRLVLVVAPAAKGDVGDGGRPLLRVGLYMVELQEGALRASPSSGGQEGALASVAPPDLAVDLPRHSAGERGGRYLAGEQVLVGGFPIRRGTDRRSRLGRGTDEGWRIRRRTDRRPWPRLGCHGKLRLLDPCEQHSATGDLTFRTVLGRSGRGASSATKASISRRLLSLAFARTDWWFSAVRCGASRRTEVRLKEPEASRSRISGKRRHARAASIRLHAASSERRRAWVQ
jgi:hypothetical protein